MWKAFGGRSERDGDRDRKQDTTSSSGRRRHRTTDDDGASVVTTASRRTDGSRKKRHHDRDDESRDKSSRREGTSGLTESAIRALDENDEAWEDDDDDLKSERRSKRSGKSRSDRDDEKDRRKEKDRVKEPERRTTRHEEREKESRRRSIDQKSSLSKSRGKSRAEDIVDAPESSRAIPAMGSFDQFPGMYDGAMIRPSETEHTMSGALPFDSHIPNQFPGQMPATYSAPPDQLNPHGAAADYYNDQGQSVDHQPGVRPLTPMMLHNPDTHLITPSAAANPVADTGNGAAADFYGGKVSPVPFQTESSSGPGSTPGRPAKRPNNALGAAAAAATVAAVAGLAGKQSQRPSTSSTPTKPARHNSAPSFAPGGGVYSAPPAVTGKLDGTNSHTNNTGLYTAAGAAAIGAAAYGLSQQHHATPNRPYGPPGQETIYATPGRMHNPDIRDYHEHRGPIQRLKDGILDMITDPDDVRKMEAYTEYIGVCKQCFDPRSSPWDGPRRHHYHPRKRDSFESIRRRISTDRLRSKRSGERLGGTSRIEKETRYAASESSKRGQGMSKAELAGIGALGAGVVTTGAMLWRDGKDFDEHSIKSGHRPSSSGRRTSRSSSRERRRRGSHGIIGSDGKEKEKWVTVRTRDGRIERRKVLARSRSRSRSRGSRDRASGWMGVAAGAALGATAADLAKRTSPERKRRDDDKVFVRRKSNTRSRSRSSSPGMSFFGSSKDKRSKQHGRRSPTSTRRDSESQQGRGLFGGFFAEGTPRKEHRKKDQGFFSFSNGSASSLDSELAFGERHHSRSSLGRKASSSSLKSRRKPTRRNSEERVAAAVAGIGATAAALAAAQRGQRLSTHSSKPELGARRDTREFVDGHSVGGVEDQEWEDELPSDVDDMSSHDGDLAFGHHERRGRMSRQSVESIGSNSSGAGLGAWRWRWGNKKKSPQKQSASSHIPSYPQDFRQSQSALPQDDNYRQASSFGPPPPMQHVDPRPVSENNRVPGSRHASMPGAFDSYESPTFQRPGVAPLQQPQPIAPISPAFTQGLNDDPLRSLASSRTPIKPRRTMSSPTRNGYGSLIGDAAVIGGAALATAGIIAAQSKKPKDSGNVRFGLTDEQQRKDNESRRREQDRELIRQREREADEQRKAERAEAAREEARRAARDEDRRREQEQRAHEEEHQRRAREESQRAREARQEAERRAAREEEQRRIREQEQRARDAQQEAERRTRENREREYAAIAAAEEEHRRASARQQAELEQQCRDYDERARAAEEQARHRARWEAEERARREADEQDRHERELAKSRESPDTRRREADPGDLGDANGRIKRSSAQDRARESSDSTRVGHNAWQGPVAAGVAGALTGAVLDGALHKEARRSQSPDDYTLERDNSSRVAAKIVEPTNEHSGAPILDDDLFDPSFFSKRKRSASETARQVEVARNAAEKIISDREAYYNAPAQTQAEIFAPPELLNRAAGEKERSTDPMGGNEVQVWHAPEAEVRQHFQHPSYSRDHAEDWLARAIPKLNVISPTPPPGHSPYQKVKIEPRVVSGADNSTTTETDESSNRRRQRAVSWGQDQTHIYQVQTPDSMIDKDSYVSAHDIPHSASTPLDDEIVVEVDDEDGNSKTTRYSKDALTGATAKSASSESRTETDDDVEEIDREADEAADAQYFAGSSDFKYKQPFFDSVSDIDLAVDSPGTEGAPPVRGWVDDDEITDPTPKEEKAPAFPRTTSVDSKTTNGGSTEPSQRDVSGSDTTSKPPTKSQKTSAFASLVGAAMGAVGVKSSSTQAEASHEVEQPIEEDAWEPPLSKKEKKKREKLAKRQSLSEDVIDTNVPEAEPIVNEAYVEPVSEPVVNEKTNLDDDFPARTLSKKDKKKLDKAAKRASIVDTEPEAVDTTTVEDVIPSSSTKPAIVDDFAFEVPLSKKERKKREKLAKRGLSFDDDSFPSTPASEQEEPDMSEATASEDRPLTNAERERADKTFGKQQGIGDVVSAMMTAGGIAALAGTSSRSRDSPIEVATTRAPAEEDEDDLWATPSKKSKKSKKKKAQLGESFEPDPRDVEPVPTYDEAKGSFTSESPTSTADKRISMPGGWDEEEPRREDASASESDKKAPSGNSESEPVEADDIWSGYESKKSKKKKTKRNSVFNEPPVSSPLRSEISRDEFNNNKQSPEHSEQPRDTNGYSNGHNGVSESPRALSPARRPDEYQHQEAGLVDNSDPDNLADDQDKAGSKRRKRRSRQGGDEDATSTVSSRSRRDEQEPAQSKDKKVGILGSLFGRKSTEAEPSSKSSTRDSEDSKQDGDEEYRSHRRRRTGSEYGDDDDTRSTTSSGRKHRHRSDKDEDADDRHRRRHHDEDDPDESRQRRRSSMDRDSRNSNDQSFLGQRVETLPPLPDSRPTSPTLVTRDDEQDNGSPASAEVNDVETSVEMPSVTKAQDRSISANDLADLPPLPDSPPASPVLYTEPHFRPFPVPVRPATSTAVPLRFKPPPPSPQPHSRTGSIESPLDSATTSPASAQRQKTPRGRTDVHSGEYKPLYLAERHSKPNPIEEDLPSLPSSKPSSRASSVHDNEDWHSAAGSMYSSPRSQRQLRLDTDLSRSHRTGEDILDSQQTTPRAGEFHPLEEEESRRREPQFYDWEDFMREQARSSQHVDAEPLSPTPISRRQPYDLDLASLPALPVSRPTSPEHAEYQRAAGEAAVGAAVLAGLAGVAGRTLLGGEEPAERSVAAAVDRDQPLARQIVQSDTDTDAVSQSVSSTVMDPPERDEESLDPRPSEMAVLSRKASKKASKKAKKVAPAWLDDEPETVTAVNQAGVVEDDMRPADDQVDVLPSTRETESSQQPLEQQSAASEPIDWDEPSFQMKKKKGKKSKKSKELDTFTTPAALAAPFSGLSGPVEVVQPAPSTQPSFAEDAELGNGGHGKPSDKMREETSAPEPEHISVSKRHIEDHASLPALPEPSYDEETDLLTPVVEFRGARAIDTLPSPKLEARTSRTKDERVLVHDPQPTAMPIDLEFVQQQASLVRLPQSPSPGLEEPVTLAPHYGLTQDSDDLRDDKRIPTTDVLQQSLVSDLSDKQQTTPGISLDKDVTESAQLEAQATLADETEDAFTNPTISRKLSKKQKKKQKSRDVFADETLSDAAAQSESPRDMAEDLRVEAQHDLATSIDTETAPQMGNVEPAREDISSTTPAPALENDFDFAPIKKGKKGRKAQRQQTLDLWADDERTPQAQSSGPVEDVAPVSQGDIVTTTPAQAPEDDLSFAPVKRGKKGKKGKQQQKLDLWADDEKKAEPQHEIQPTARAREEEDDGTHLSHRETAETLSEAAAHDHENSQEAGEAALHEKGNSVLPELARQGHADGNLSAQMDEADVEASNMTERMETPGKSTSEDAAAVMTDNDTPASRFATTVVADESIAEASEDAFLPFTTKKSKKDKRKSKNVDVNDAPAEAKATSILPGLLVGAAAATSAIIAGAAATILPSKLTSQEEDAKDVPAKKQSKKDKRKSKKNAWSAFDAEDEQSTSTADEAGQVPTQIVAESTTLQPSMAVDDQSSAATIQTEPASRSLADAINIPLPSPGEDEVALLDKDDHVIATPAPLPEQANAVFHGPPRRLSNSDGKSHPISTTDLEFAATLAAGLHDSGFDPSLVVDDPVFHRRASPPNMIAEADPEENVAASTTRRRKNKSRSVSPESAQVAEQMPLVAELPTSVKGSDDFDDVLSQGLANAGFDAALLQQATTPDAEPLQKEENEADFFVPIKQKRRKGKQKALPFDYEATSDSSPLPMTPIEASAESSQRETMSLELAAPDLTEDTTSAEQIGFANGHDAHDTARLEHEIRPAPPQESTVQTSDTLDWDFPTKVKGKKGKWKQATMMPLKLDSSNAKGEVPVVAAADDSVELPLTQFQPTHDRDMVDQPYLDQEQARDVEDADDGFKAYKKNRRKAKKEKAAQAAAFNDTAAKSQEDLFEEHTTLDRQDVSYSRAIDASMPSEIPQVDNFTERPPSRSSTPDQRRRRGGKVVVHTSEVSQSPPVAVERSPRAIHRNIADEEFTATGESRDESFLARHSDLPLTAMMAAGTASAFGAAVASHETEHTGGHRPTPDQDHETDAQGHSNSAIQEPSWSFSGLEDNDVPESARDVGEFGSPVHQASRSYNIPEIRQVASRESLSNRRSLEPLHVNTEQEMPWNMPMSKQRTATKTQQQFEAPRSRTPSNETPLEPTSRNRASYLFQTTPETTPEAKSKHISDEHAAPEHIHEAQSADSHEKQLQARTSAMSPIARITSPRAALHSIPEESRATTRTVNALAFEPTQQDSKARRRAFSPSASDISSNTHGRALSPADDNNRRVVSTPLDYRLLHDHDTDARSHRRVFTDPRSSSVLSNRSIASNGIHRVPEELRSLSRASSGSHAPSLRRISVSGDLRSASRSSNQRGSPKTIPFEPPPTPPLYDEDIIDSGASRAINMSDVFQGYGDRHESHISPIRPPSVRKRQSMHIIELESRLDQLASENRALAEARREIQDGGEQHGLRRMLEDRELEMREKDVELHRIRTMLAPMQAELERLTEINNGLTEANRNLVDDTNGRYATLQAEHEQTHQQWMGASRELESMRSQQTNLATDVRDAIAPELNAALAEKDHEIRKLREELEIATERIRALQVEIQATKKDNFLVYRDEDYIDGACQKLCQHAQQWVLRFSKTSDNRVCRLSSQLGDDKIETRLDNAILDGSDVDKLLADRTKRRDVLMSVVTTMIWEYVFTRYLFGMDREQRQKLKALEKTLAEVGPPRAVAQWRATTLTLLCKRQSFEEQCALDTEAVAHEIFGVLCSLLPPPANAEQQLLQSLQRVIKVAVELSIEMRTQKAEYIMLPPLQPEYDDNGDLRSKMFFNSQLMNERSGNYNSNEELEADRAVVKLVLFPPVIKKGDDFGEGSEETVVCPAQVLIHNDGGRSKKVVRVMSGAMDIDDPRASRQSLISTVPGNSTI